MPYAERVVGGAANVSAERDGYFVPQANLEKWALTSAPLL